MLFRWGKFVGAAGHELDWKIECDALTDDDWTCIASVVAPRFRAGFSSVVGVPHGGLKLARAFTPFATGSGPILVVDDVWTTGKSMTEFAIGLDAAWIGFVAFSRGSLPENVQAFAHINYK